MEGNRAAVNNCKYVVARLDSMSHAKKLEDYTSKWQVESRDEIIGLYWLLSA